MIKIVSLGPGNPSYILPLAIDAIKSCDLVISAKRHINSIKQYNSSTLDYSGGFDQIKKILEKHNENETIVIAVSGDVGFYSMLNFVKGSVDVSQIVSIPGISSLAYLYSKLNLGYEKATWISLHGRDFDLEGYIQDKRELGILLDKEQNNQFVGLRFKEILLEMDKQISDKEPVFYIGENLSYDNEKISRLSMNACIEYKAKDLSVVIVRYE